jgi:hypothetical protein
VNSQAITLPPPEAAASSPPLARLNLALPPSQRAGASAPTAASLVQKDVRIHPGLNRDEKLSRQLGTAPAEEVTLLDGGRRIRQGPNCMVIRPARDGQLNPWNQSTHPLPAQVGDCR